MQESNDMEIELKNAKHIERIVNKMMFYKEQISNGFSGYIHSKYPDPDYVHAHRITLWKGLYDYLQLEIEKLYDFKYKSKILDEFDETLNIALSSISNTEKIDNSTMLHVENVCENCMEFNKVDILEEFPEDIKRYM